jgi:PAS domain S-box-containing protein
MQYVVGQLLEQSCDAIAVSRLRDGLLLEVNEAFHAVTGYRRAELVGHAGLEPFVWLYPDSMASFAMSIRERGSISGVRAGLRTRSGELRVGTLSGVAFTIDDEVHTLAIVQGSRVPTRAERRAAARAELHRIVRDWGGSPRGPAMALRALGECLQWDLGNLWTVAPDGGLRCRLTWCSPLSGLEQLQELRSRMTFAPGQGPLGRVWKEGVASWVSSVADQGAFVRAMPAIGQEVHGWFAFPATLGGRVFGLVEFFSGEIRQQDADLLDMLDGFGREFGALLVSGEAGDGAAPGGKSTGQRGDAEPDRLAHSKDLDQGLAIRVRELTRLLSDESAEQSSATVRRGGVITPFPSQGPSRTEPPSPVSDATSGRRLAPRFTLKALSERTGVPAATLRTWQRRYGIIRPARTASGYRLFSDGDVARILEVKQLVDGGVRISEAAAALAEEDGEPPAPTAHGSGPSSRPG